MGSQGRRYDEEVKKFALTLNFYSPRAYEYICGVFSLPHSNSLTEWTSSVECEPDIFNMDVLKNLNSRITLYSAGKGNHRQVHEKQTFKTWAILYGNDNRKK